MKKNNDVFSVSESKPSKKSKSLDVLMSKINPEKNSDSDRVAFQVVMERGLRKKFKAVAAENGKSYSEILKQFIEDYVRQCEQEKEKKR
jgi:hypothetical protein